MSRKPNTHTAVRRLFEAASDIVHGTRNVMHESTGKPHHHAEVHIPILFGGTDMRVTVEAGPSVAMRNAVENAAMQASDKPYIAPGAKAKSEAVALLATYASEIKDAGQCLEGKWMDAEDERHFGRVVAAMKALGVTE